MGIDRRKKFTSSKGTGGFQRNRESSSRPRTGNRDSSKSSFRGKDFNESRDRRGKGSGKSNFKSKDKEFKDKFKVTCDGCGKQCEVPFKPTAGKPVYCSECFRGKPSKSDSNRSSGSKNSNDNLSEINKKLDKILSLLEK
ncbi:MAG: CxxC-x17-CxxC domain-containing protein [Nanoarchaeota archaeon]